jgi:hypothetical protein
MSVRSLHPVLNVVLSVVVASARHAAFRSSVVEEQSVCQPRSYCIRLTVNELGVSLGAAEGVLPVEIPNTWSFLHR